MKTSTRRALWIGGLALAAVAVGGGVAYAASSSTSGTSGGGGNATQLITGHRYRATSTGTNLGIQQLTQGQAQANVDGILGGGYATVNSITYTTSNNTITATLIFTVKGPTEPVPPLLTQADPGFVFTLTDLGPVALPPPKQKQGINPNEVQKVPPQQAQNVQQQNIAVQPGQTYTAANAGDGALLTITAPSKIMQLVKDASVKSALPWSGNQVTLILSGKAGQVQVTAQGPAATVNLPGSM